ncbi:hypothetical protein QJS10_CPB14g01499 [Acorus calamus]|uniref:ACT domain-containing protein ACR n=1 Tax=Acorus calamus TaxID=4465 RepID=A0AAV9DD21_ACOCL|nr:hypothetical protein QJS10_CPB14g01499 [Acorus calamus]
MGVSSEDVVVIQKQQVEGKRERESEGRIITVNCPDKTGLGCDLCRIILEFGLCITRGDVSTDGKWCYVVFWVVPRSTSVNVNWGNLKNRLLSICPSCTVTFYFNSETRPSVSPVYLLKLFCLNRAGLLHGLSLDLKKVKSANISMDNSLSPAHTLLQIHCIDQKGLIYDILRTLKDCNIQIAYGRFLSDTKGYREIDLFIQQTDGKKIVDPEKQNGLCSRLRMEMLHPLRVITVNRGPDTELLVANPVELSGKGRPRVFYDMTVALKLLGICIFSAEIGRHSTQERQWEVYRFLLDESPNFPLSNNRARNQIVDRVRRTLMGW